MITIADEDKETMIKAVEITALALDEKIPKWREMIDWEMFRFVSYSTCIYGQLSKVHDTSDISELPGFDLPSHLRSKYVEDDTCFIPRELFSFMEGEWRKVAKKDLTTAA